MLTDRRLMRSRSYLQSNRQSASAHAVAIHYDNALRDIGLRQGLQDFTHARDYIGLAPVTVAEQDEAWIGDLGEREQARIVKIGRDHRPTFLFRAGHDVSVGRPVKTQLGDMDGIVSLIPEPCRQCRRKRHVDKKAHASARCAEFNGLVLGEERRVT